MSLTHRLAACTIAATITTPCLGADGQHDTASDDADLLIEEVTVTARKRAESIQSVPISIAAFSGSDLEQRHAQTMGDVARFTPSVVISQAASASGGNRSSSVYIRGIGQSDATGFAEPAVGLYIDGVYFGRSVGSLLDIVDLDRIEVLKGPQGTLFGKNTEGGAISIVSALPTGEFGGYLEASGGSFDEFNLRGSIQFPIVAEQLAAKLSISRRKRDGYTPSLSNGNEFDDVDSSVARGIVRWTPTPNASLTVIGDVSRVREAEQGFHLLTAQLNPAAPFGGSLSIVNTLPGAAPSTPFGAFDNRWISAGQDFTYANGLTGVCNCSNVDAEGASATLDWTFGQSTTLTSITAYRAQDSFVNTDLDASPLDFFANYIESDQHQFSEELRLGGSAFDDRLAWLIGGYYFYEKIDESVNIRGGHVGALRAVSQMNTVRPEITTQAVFTQGTFKLTDRLSVTGGFRYNRDHKRIPAQSLNLLTNVFVLPLTTKENTWNSTTPRLDVAYQATPDALLYASWSKGFKSGGFDYRISRFEFLPFGPEKVSAYEAGFKTDWLDRRLRVNGAAYVNRQSDVQIRGTVTPGTLGCPLTTVLNCNSILNGTSVDIQGAEVEITALPAAGWELSGAVGYMHQEFDKINPNLLQINAANPRVGVNLDSQVPRTPEWTYMLGTQYRFPVGGAGEVTLRADYSYQSRIYFELPNHPLQQQSGYGLLGLRAAFTSADGQWEMAVAGQNVTDERYANATILFASFNLLALHYGAPATWTGTLKYRF